MLPKPSFPLTSLFALVAVGSLAATTLLLLPPPSPEKAKIVKAKSSPVSSHQTEKKRQVAEGVLSFTGNLERHYTLKAGDIREISLSLPQPSKFPPNAKFRVEWISPTDKIPVIRKTLHALDTDFFCLYRASVAGVYTLRLTPISGDAPPNPNDVHWRERGSILKLTSETSKEALKPDASTRFSPLVKMSVRPVNVGTEKEQERLRTILAVEPNNTPSLAQPITLTPSEGETVKTWEITGSSDEQEYFDGGEAASDTIGKAGEDWFRLDFKGKEPRLFTAQISLPGQSVVARVRVYRPSKKAEGVEEFFGVANPRRPLFNEGQKTSVEEGRDPNERNHQQDEPHRTEISRLFMPGQTYYLRVEANAPGYQLQLRLLPPAPYKNPRLSIRQGTYNQIGQVDAWLSNRPRGASLERRIRDTGNLLGTGCMSCHTQSGVWGPAAPFVSGYRPENVQNYWHLINTMYECLRPTNTLKDAANNTSLAPLDIGDGPAGTRAAGFNIVQLERFLTPRKLHSKQQIRTANFVLQTSDPGGINAAGPGSNVGFVIVNTMASEILKTAWTKTGDPKYFRALQQKAQQVLEVNPQFTDDVGLRLDYFYRVFPVFTKYVEWETKAAKADGKPFDPAKNSAFLERVRVKLSQDETRLRAIQNEDGSFGFNPGSSPDNGKTWKAGDHNSDPSPTSLAIWGLTSAGHGLEDPAVSKASSALIAMQEPTGRWNRGAQTGFVSTAYALHALSRLYPETPPPLKRADFMPKVNESLLESVGRIRELALHGEGKFPDLLLKAAQHDSPLVRYWAYIGLGATSREDGVPALIVALGDSSKMVREAAVWATRQTLLNDFGWSAIFSAYEKGTDTTRQSLLMALNLRADAVMPRSKVDFVLLTSLFNTAMNRDLHPGVRAWASKAAWQWWVWNPPTRKAINAAWKTALTRPEPDSLVETCLRYSTQALFVVNGHKANGSGEHQYPELTLLFAAMSDFLDTEKNAEIRLRLAKRLVNVGATYYETSGGDGGPGQMGYVTPNSGEMMGKAALIVLNAAVKGKSEIAIRLGIEGGANVPYRPLNEWLVNYSLTGPESLRQIAAQAVSDPRSVSLPAVPEQVEPQMAQIKRGAMEPPRRPQISDPIVELWAKVNWIIPKSEEQQRRFFDILVPQFSTYRSPEQLAQITDPALRGTSERDMSASWYLADRLGEVLERNPDLHQEIVFRKYFPTEFKNPLEARFWIRSVDWLLSFEETSNVKRAARGEMVKNSPRSGLSLVRGTLRLQEKIQTPRIEAPTQISIVKDKALQLYLDALKADADPMTRALAIRRANQTSLRSNTEVLRALRDALAYEKDPELRQIIEGVLRQGDATFLPDLMKALKEEKHANTRFDEKGNPILEETQKIDLVYFRDYVMPELTRQKRNDQQSCMGCHGLKGRVPSFYLRPPDKFGFTGVGDLLANYRTVQGKINLSDLPKSKFLRKPLNVQDGKEDGHQGGRRYTPADSGYLLLKKWAENQLKLQKKAAKASPGNEFPGCKSAKSTCVDSMQKQRRSGQIQPSESSV